MNKNVKFNGYMIRKFLLEKIDDIPKEKQNSVNLDYGSSQNDEKENSYLVSLNVSLYTKQSKLELILDGFFEIPNDLESDIKENFLNVSAPAILYPYVRSFISSVTSFDVGDAVILPVINFSDPAIKPKK